MTDSTIVSYVGPNKPGLISKTMDCLTKLGGNIGDLSFATLGKGCECTLIYELSDETKKSDVEKALKKLDALSSGDLVVKDFEQDQERGPSKKITHRIIFSGGDQKGLISKIISTLDNHGALIVRMNAEKIEGKDSDQYISRFSISIRDEKAPACLAAVVTIASELKLLFRYETN